MDNVIHQRNICFSNLGWSKGYYQREAQILMKQFIERGYPRKVLNMANIRTQNTVRVDLLCKKPPQPQNRLTWALDFTSLTRPIQRIIQRHWHIVEHLPGCHYPPIIGLRRTQGIRNILIRTGIQHTHPVTYRPTGHYPCGKCTSCPQAWRTSKLDFQDKKIGKTLGEFTNCSTKWSIYLLECPCGLHYVGSSRHALKTRLSEHRSRIKNNIMEAPLVAHFYQYSDFRTVIIETIHTEAFNKVDRYRRLLQRELYWIFRFKTYSPHGLNMEMDLTVYV